MLLKFEAEAKSLRPRPKGPEATGYEAETEAKIGRCKVAEKSSRIADKKPGVADTFEPPISPPLNRSRPKFRERCRPLTCACVSTLVRICCGFPDLFRKESKKVNTI